MRPVFIGGCVRSGTTMLGAILGAHPRHVCPPEMPFKFDMLRAAAADGALSAGEAHRVAEGHWKASALGWHLDAQRWDFAASTVAEAAEGIVRGYGELHGRPDPVVWIDHTPVNVRFAAALAKAFPEASFVHVVRDGRAVMASMMRVEWGPDGPLAAARMWTERVAQGMAAETALHGRCARVRYEDVVAEPEPTLRRLCRDIGIEYHPAMLTGSGFSATPYIASQHALVGRPPDASRLDAWTEQLADREVEIFEAAVGDLLPLLGYEPRFGLNARAATRKERQLAELRQVVLGRTVNRLRKRLRLRAARRP